MAKRNNSKLLVKGKECISYILVHSFWKLYESKKN